MFTILREKEFFKSSSLVLLTNCFSQIILFFLNFYLSKKFGPELFGSFKAALYFFTFLPLLVDLGASTTIVKYTAEFYVENREKLKHLLRWFLKLRFFTYFLLLTLLFLLKEQMITTVFKNFDSNLFLAGTIVTASYFFSIFSSLVQGLQNFKLYSLITISFNIIIAFSALVLSNFGVSHALLSWSFGAVAYLFALNFLFKKGVFQKPKKKFDMKKIFFKFSLPMTFFHASGAISIIIVPILSIFFSSKAVGYYSFVFMFYWPTLLIPSALQTVLFPKVSELDGLKDYTNAKNLLKRTLKIYFLIVIIGLLAILFFSDKFIYLIAREYLPALPIFKSLTAFGLFSGFFLIYKAYFIGLAKIKKVLLLILIQNLFLFVISFVLLSTLNF